jgi:hypothetical protein
MFLHSIRRRKMIHNNAKRMDLKYLSPRFNPQNNYVKFANYFSLTYPEKR